MAPVGAPEYRLGSLDSVTEFVDGKDVSELTAPASDIELAYLGAGYTGCCPYVDSDDG